MVPKMKFADKRFADAGRSHVIEQQECLNADFIFVDVRPLQNPLKFCSAKIFHYAVVTFSVKLLYANRWVWIWMIFLHVSCYAH